ncbi:MAG TPA: hypothetical protein VHC18_18320 [Amycolatopsis sp.]|jgi:hypothetical protein|nr:hypothetical protein [Amycolatopsis sp.]
MTTYQEAIDGFGQSVAAGIALRDSLTCEEAAKISNGYLSGRFTLAEMTERIRARRAEASASRKAS